MNNWLGYRRAHDGHPTCVPARVTGYLPRVSSWVSTGTTAFPKTCITAIFSPSGRGEHADGLAELTATVHAPDPAALLAEVRAVAARPRQHQADIALLRLGCHLPLASQAGLLAALAALCEQFGLDVL